MFNTSSLEFKKWTSQKGFTLLELLVAAGILSFLMLTVFYIFNTVIVSFQKNQVIAARDQVSISIRQSLNNDLALKISMKDSSNPNLLNCICGGIGSCDSSQVYPLSLFEGSASAPKLVSLGYDIDGTSCDIADPKCIIKVNLSFIPQCLPTLPSADPTPAVLCAGQPAEFLALVYSINLQTNGVATNLNLKPIRGVVFKTIDDLVSNNAGFCL